MNTTSRSTTPSTDDQVRKAYLFPANAEVVSAEFARKLEEQLNNTPAEKASESPTDLVIKAAQPMHEGGFRVVGPNLADGRITTWYMGSISEAKNFAEGIAAQMDSEYDILEYVGTVRQVLLAPRPIEWVPADKKAEATPPI